MKKNLVIGFIGRDKPGIVRALTDVVTAEGGNWLESRMNKLADRFAGIAMVEIEAAKLPALKTALAQLENLTVWTDEAEVSDEVANVRCLGLNIVGPDRPGILRDVTLALETHVANLVELESNVAAAPMSGELTFSADAVVEIDYQMDYSQLAQQLDEVATRLGVDILLEDDPDQ